MTTSNYNEFIAQPGGELVRFLQTINGFRATHKSWPSRVQMDSIAHKTLSEHLTCRGMQKVKEKIQIDVCEDSHLLAFNEDGLSSQYSWSAGEPDLKADEWLGLVV